MLWTYVIIAVVAVVVLLIVFRMVWRVAEPNEALIISGLGAHSSPSRSTRRSASRSSSAAAPSSSRASRPCGGCRWTSTRPR